MELHSSPPLDGDAAAEMPEADVHVVTSTGLLITVHSKILVLSLSLSKLVKIGAEAFLPSFDSF